MNGGVWSGSIAELQSPPVGLLIDLKSKERVKQKKDHSVIYRVVETKTRVN